MRCTVEGCTRVQKAKGYCASHYMAWWRRGDPTPVGPPHNVGALCTVPGCGKPHAARGYCTQHWGAWRRHGDPTVVREVHHYGKSLADRIALYTRRTANCWEWIGGRNKKGYGIIGDRSTPSLAHRAVWELEHGKVPRGLFVLHRCDNPGCVRSDHLFLGTAKDNTDDMVAKGRQHTKLDDAIVKTIMGSSETGAALAAEYGVSGTLISRIRSGKAWRHLR